MAEEATAAPVVEAAPVAPEAAPVAAVEAPAPAESLVSVEATSEAAAPLAEVAEPEPVVEATEPVVEAAPELPVYTEFKLPQGVTAAPEQMEAFTSLAGKHGLAQDDAQAFLDLYSVEAKRYAESVEAKQRDVWDETRAGWRADVDRRFGNRRDTVLNDARWAITELVPNEAQRKSLWSALDVTGAGDHPEIVNLLSAAARKMRERAAPPQGIAARAAPTDPADRRYGVRPAP